MKANVLTAIAGALITTVGAIVVAYMQFHQPTPSDKMFSATGYVRDARTHAPVSGASVLIEFNGSPIQTSTDDGGYYQFKVKSGEPNVEIRRKISAAGYVTQDQTANITLGSQGDLLLVPTRSPPPATSNLDRIVSTDTGINDFAGQWVNANARTAGITKLAIENRGREMLVHAWGKCEPKDCDWGIQAGPVMRQTLIINWNQGFVNRKMILIKRDATLLVCTTDSVYTDGRPEQHSSETFKRGER